MKRRIRWPLTLRGWFEARRRRPVGADIDPELPPHMPSRIVIRFRDGSSVILNPKCQAAIEMHSMADRWLAGG
jgi:hypothetical protein